MHGLPFTFKFHKNITYPALMGADGSIPKTKVVGTVPGLCVLKHNAVRVKGLACDDGKKIIILQIQIFFVRLGDTFCGHFSFTGYDLQPKGIFHIIINRMSAYFRR